jgi:ABC-2 type transport system permease protein
MLWAAAKIFRVGVLMYGKPPSLVELVKWVRRA